jgi:ABC-type branched-subunit amino acid transport system ATPase component
MKKIILELDKISNIIVEEDQFTAILDELSLKIYTKELIQLKYNDAREKKHLVGMICGLRGPTAGSIELLNKSVKKNRRLLSMPDGVKLISDTIPLFEDKTIGENLLIACRAKKISKKEALKIIESFLLYFNLNIKIDHKMSDLSMVNRSIISFGVGVITKPDLLIIDSLSALYDDNFIEKINNYLIEFIKSGSSVMIISEADLIGLGFTRSMELNHGKIKISKRNKKKPKNKAELRFKIKTLKRGIAK